MLIPHHCGAPRLQMPPCSINPRYVGPFCYMVPSYAPFQNLLWDDPVSDVPAWPGSHRPSVVWPGLGQAKSGCVLGRPGMAPGLGFDFVKPQAVGLWLCHLSHFHHQTQWASSVSTHLFFTFNTSI